jgi:hypothetical protein
MADFVLTENLSDNFDVTDDVGGITVDASTVDVSGATNITATTLLDALSEIGGRLDVLEP